MGLTSCAVPTAMGVSRGPALARATVHVPGGPFLMGSTLDERAVAIELDYASLGQATPEISAWVKREFRQSTVEVDAFRIMRTPVTQREYVEFMRDTGAPEPFVDAATWMRQDLGITYAKVQKFLWYQGLPKPDRATHPVVLVDHAGAGGLLRVVGPQDDNTRGRLPSEAQWEKAARGTAGQAYPWGRNFDPNLLNGFEAQLDDTLPVGTYTDAESPYGAQDMAGNVFEWTSTPLAGEGFVVKGGAFTTTGGSRGPPRGTADPARFAMFWWASGAWQTRPEMTRPPTPPPATTTTPRLRLSPRLSAIC